MQSYEMQVWQLYLFYGVMTGLGVGFIYPGMMAYVVRLYPERSGAASGLGTAAYGSGAILWAPSMVALSDALSLSRAFCILGLASWQSSFSAPHFCMNLPKRQPPQNIQLPQRRVCVDAKWFVQPHFI